MQTGANKLNTVQIMKSSIRTPLGAAHKLNNVQIIKSSVRAALGSAQRSKLAQDNRGAIAIAGLFMALFLIGALWYVVGIGDAILFRERVQDGTDAVAFTSAVYHARTMNLIASLNIVISVLLGLLIAAKIIYWLNNLVFGIAAACTFFPPTSVICAKVASISGPLIPKLKKVKDKAQDIYDAVGPTINKAQYVAAVTGPWYAQYKSVKATNDYQPDLSGGFTVSMSLVPGFGKGNKRIALPVQEGTPTQLCKRTSKGIVNLLFLPFGDLGEPVKDLVGDEMEDGVSAFCDDGGKKLAEAQEKATEDQVDKSAKNFCDWEQRVANTIYQIRQSASVTGGDTARKQANNPLLDRLYKEAYETSPERADRNLHRCYKSPITHIFDGRGRPSTDLTLLYENGVCGKPWPQHHVKCMREMREHYRAQMEEAHEDAEDAEEGEPKKRPNPKKRKKAGKRSKPRLGKPKPRVDTVPYVLFDEAAAGDGYFQVFAFTWADTTRVTDDSKIVAVADHSRQRSKDKVESFAANSIARAEFFYDGVYDPIDSMWNLRWRASMRRFWPPKAESLPVLGKLLQSDAFKSMQAQLSDVLGSVDDPELEDGMNLLLGKELTQQVKDDAQEAQKWVNDPEGMAWAHYGAIH